MRYGKGNKPNRAARKARREAMIQFAFTFFLGMAFVLVLNYITS
jgi:hypothetical protein